MYPHIHTSVHATVYKDTSAHNHSLAPVCSVRLSHTRASARPLLRPRPSHTSCTHTQLALQALQTVVSRDVKPSDVEVCVVRTQQPKVTRLTDDEIEAHLTAIAERD